MRALMVFAGCCSASLSWAQCAPVDLGRVAELYGVVRASGSPVSGAKLSVEAANRKKPPVETTLGSDGHFRFLRLPPGKYVMLIHRKAVPDNRYYVEVLPRAKHKPLDVTLQIAGVC
jgi:hypothetical protein